MNGASLPAPNLTNNKTITPPPLSTVHCPPSLDQPSKLFQTPPLANPICSLPSIHPPPPPIIPNQEPFLSRHQVRANRAHHVGTEGSCRSVTLPARAFSVSLLHTCTRLCHCRRPLPGQILLLQLLLVPCGGPCPSVAAPPHRHNARALRPNSCHPLLGDHRAAPKPSAKQKLTQAPDYSLSNPDTLTKYKTAAQISEKVLAEVSKLVVPGAKIVDICQQGDKLIEEEVAKVYRGKKITKGLSSQPLPPPIAPPSLTRPKAFLTPPPSPLRPTSLPTPLSPPMRARLVSRSRRASPSRSSSAPRSMASVPLFATPSSPPPPRRLASPSPAARPT